MQEVNIAIVGATGAVGEVMLEPLAERDFPARSVSLCQRAVGGLDTVQTAVDHGAKFSGV